MSKVHCLIAASLCLGATQFASAQQEPPKTTPLIKLVKPGQAQPAKQVTKPAEPKKTYDEAADAKEQIAAALAKAKKENQRVLIQWGANWCGWCHLLDGKFQSDAKVRKELLYEYQLIHVDIGRFDKHMDIAASYGADLKSNGVPFLTVLDADGNVLANQETGSLEAKIDGENGHDAAKIMGFLTKHEPAPLKAEDILAAGLSEAANTDKNVFLHFGAPWCVWCHRLENWMARPEIATILAKDYVDVKIDTDRAIGGEEMLIEKRKTEEGGIPWFAILDQNGKGQITSNRSDDPRSNIGYPSHEEPEGIAHMIKMIDQTRSRITDEELATLKTSLEAKPKAKEGTH